MKLRTFKIDAHPELKGISPIILDGLSSIVRKAREKGYSDLVGSALYQAALLNISSVEMVCREGNFKDLTEPLAMERASDIFDQRMVSFITHCAVEMFDFIATVKDDDYVSIKALDERIEALLDVQNVQSEYFGRFPAIDIALTGLITVLEYEDLQPAAASWEKALNATNAHKRIESSILLELNAIEARRRAGTLDDRPGAPAVGLRQGQNFSIDAIVLLDDHSEKYKAQLETYIVPEEPLYLLPIAKLVDCMFSEECRNALWSQKMHPVLRAKTVTKPALILAYDRLEMTGEIPDVDFILKMTQGLTEKSVQTTVDQLLNKVRLTIANTAAASETPEALSPVIRPARVGI